MRVRPGGMIVHPLDMLHHRRQCPIWTDKPITLVDPLRRHGTSAGIRLAAHLSR